MANSVEKIDPDRNGVITDGEQSRFIEKIFDHGAAESGGHANNICSLDLNGFLMDMDIDNLLACFSIGIRNMDNFIKTTGTCDGLVKDIGTIGGTHNEHISEGLKAVHESEELIECGIALATRCIIGTTTFASNRVEFIDKEDGGLIIRGELEELTETGRADADIFFIEFGTGAANKAGIGFTGKAASQESLTITGGAFKQDATGDTDIIASIVFGMIHHIDDLEQFILNMKVATDGGKVGSIEIGFDLENTGFRGFLLGIGGSGAHTRPKIVFFLFFLKCQRRASVIIVCRGSYIFIRRRRSGAKDTISDSDVVISRRMLSAINNHRGWTTLLLFLNVVNIRFHMFSNLTNLSNLLQIFRRRYCIVQDDGMSSTTLHDRHHGTALRRITKGKR